MDLDFKRLRCVLLLYTEADWTDPDTPGLAPYPRSKVIAERAAWDFMKREGGDTELVVVNPTFILGPALLTQLVSSLRLIEAMLDGKMPAVPRRRFGVADVRDVADLHIRAMAAPEAGGKRFLALADGPTVSYLEVALAATGVNDLATLRTWRDLDDRREAARRSRSDLNSPEWRYGYLRARPRPRRG